jgi:hypothetical protein
MNIFGGASAITNNQKFSRIEVGLVSFECLRNIEFMILTYSTNRFLAQFTSLLLVLVVGDRSKKNKKLLVWNG